MAILFVLLLPALFVGVPAALWFRSRDEARRRWLPTQQGTTRLGDDNYRGAEVPNMVASGPPPLVHVTAVMCWILGVAFVPGLALSLLGVLVMGIGLIGLPGLVAAAKLFRLGGPLLRGEPQAAEGARAAARLVRWLNYVVVAASAGFLAWCGWYQHRDGFISSDMRAVVTMALLTALYAGVSLVHARMLELSADRIDADHARRADALRESTGVRFDAGEAAPLEGADALDLAEAQAAARQRRE